MTTQNQPDSDKLIILDLSRTSDVLNFPDDEVFQEEARAILYSKINEQLHALPKKGVREESEKLDDIFYERHHNAITICGSRGSGKSTLIRHVLSSMHKNSKYENNKKSLNDAIPVGISVLPVIDPTLISSKEHVLIILISLMREKVNNSSRRISEEDISKYQAALKKLAGGLCQMDGIGPTSNYGDEWEDKNYILETGLVKAREGKNLEKHFNDFIDKALTALGKDAFVITFDDIDTQFERGWPVLETVRKYLTSPRLIILISGDIELYTTLVRAAQFESLGKNVLEYDRPSVSFHNPDDVRSYSSDPLIKKITDLEEQYLMKVLKPQNRVHMLTLEQWRQKYKGDIHIKETGENAINIKLFMDRVFKLGFGVKKSNEQAIYLETILNMPARTLMEMMYASRKVFNSVESPDKVKELLDFSLNINSVNSSSFSNIPLKITDFQIAHYSVSKTIKMFVDWGVTQDVWSDYSNLLPIYHDDKVNSQIITFSTLIQSQIKYSFKKALYWMMVLGNVKCLFEDFKFKKSDVNHSELLNYLTIERNNANIVDPLNRCLLASLYIHEDAEYIGIYRIPLRKVNLKIGVQLEKLYTKSTFIGNVIKSQKRENAFVINTAIKNLPQNKLLENDLLGEWWSVIKRDVYSDDESFESLKMTYEGTMFNRFDTIANSFGSFGLIAFLSTFTTAGVKKSENISFCSFNALLANILQLLNMEVSSIAELKSNVSQLLIETKVFSPTWKINDSKPIDSDEHDNLEDDSNSIGEDADLFFELLYKWIGCVDRVWSDLSLSSSLLIRVFERYTNFVRTINLKPNDLALGNILHFQIIALFQAILVEESIDRGASSMSMKNIIGTEREFFQNYTKMLNIGVNKTNKLTIQSHIEKMKNLEVEIESSLFAIMFSCPLIAMFLRPEPKEYNNMPKDWDWLEMHAVYFLKLTSSDGSSIENHLEKLSVRGNIKSGTNTKKSDVEIKFRNLNTILNTVPITAPSSKQNLGAEINEPEISDVVEPEELAPEEEEAKD